MILAIKNYLDRPEAESIGMVDPGEKRFYYLTHGTEMAAGDLWTPLTAFGCLAEIDRRRMRYRVFRLGQSTATYADGKPREWQEPGGKNPSPWYPMGWGVAEGEVQDGE